MSRKEYYSEDQYEQEQYDDIADTESVSAASDDFLEEEAENDVKYVFRLINMLRNELEMAKNVPFSSARMVDAEKCMNILDDIENTLPDAVKRGAWAYEQSEEMLRKAQDETRRHMASQEIQFQMKMEKREKRMAQNEQNAENRAKKILADAERMADNMVRQGVIDSRVEEEVRAIRSNAQAQAHDIQLRVDDACYKKLDDISTSMTKMLKEINRMRAQFETE